MTDIRVDPEELANAARQLEEAAERLRQLAEEAHALGASAPSYGGQFGPHVERLGLEALSALSSQAQRLALHSEDLAQLSAAFAEADRETAAGLEAIGKWFGEWWQRVASSLPPWLVVWLWGRGVEPRSQQTALETGVLAGAPEALTGQTTATPTGTPEVVSTPMPPKVAPGHTPTPPGWVAPPRPTPTPSTTPAFEELAAQREAAWEEHHTKWLVAFGRDLEACAESSDPEPCIAGVARSIYHHRGIPLEQLAATGQDNPLPEDSEEFGLLAQMALHYRASPENHWFVDQLGITPEHLTNYEPAYLEALKGSNQLLFRQALDWLAENREIHEAWNETLLKQMLKWGVGGNE